MTTTIYTSIYNSYDTIRSPLSRHPSASWHCISDGTVKMHPPYKEMIVHHEDNLSPRRSSRKSKILSHHMFPDSDVTIWHGGNVQLQGDLLELESLVYPSGIAVLSHSQRHCAYEEAKMCSSWKKDHPDIIQSQMDRYRSEGYPEDNGLAAAFLIVRSNTNIINEFNLLWWEEVSLGSHRDQLSFNYCCWRLGIKPTVIPGDIFTGPYHKRFPSHG